MNPTTPTAPSQEVKNNEEEIVIDAPKENTEETVVEGEEQEATA